MIRSSIRRFIRALSGLIRTVFPLPPPPSKALLRTYMHTYMPFLPFPRASWRLIRNKRGAYPEPRRNERNRVRHPFIRLYPARLRQALSIRVFAYPAIIRGLSPLSFGALYFPCNTVQKLWKKWSKIVQNRLQNASGTLL